MKLAQKFRANLSYRTSWRPMTWDLVSKQNKKITCSCCSQMKGTHLGLFSMPGPLQTLWPIFEDPWFPCSSASAKALAAVLSTWPLPPPPQLCKSQSTHAGSVLFQRTSLVHMPAKHAPPTWTTYSDTIQNSFPEQTSSYFRPLHLSSFSLLSLSKAVILLSYLTCLWYPTCMYYDQ